jgi:hypothetical protein
MPVKTSTKCIKENIPSMLVMEEDAAAAAVAVENDSPRVFDVTTVFSTFVDIL